MKRILLIILCLSLLLAGCKKEVPADTSAPTTQPTTAPTTAPTTVPTTEPTTAPSETEPPVPETLSATALTDDTAVVLTTLERNAVVEIVDEYEEDYYVVKTEQGYGLIEKRLVRMDGEAGYEAWDGYAVYQAKVYNNYHLLSEGVTTLNMNTQVQVIDSFGDCLVVQLEEGIGYMRGNEVSRSYIQPAPSGGGNAGGADGGDITLGGFGGVTLLSNFIPQSGEVSGKGTVLVDEAEIILGWFDRNEAVDIVNEEGFIDEKEGWYGIYYDGLYGYIRQNLIRQDTQEAYAEWDGFAKYQAQLFDNYYLSGEPISKLNSNASVHILEDLGDCYLATSGEHTGYIAKDMVSETFINYSSGGGNNNASGGDWTPPAL